MRVLHVIPSLELAEGGPAHAVRRMANLAAASGHEVTIAASHTSEAGTLRAEAECALGEQRVQIVGASASVSSGAAAWQLGRFLLDGARRFDLVHIHGLFSPVTCLAAMAARRARIPYILRPAGQLDPWSLSQKAGKKRLYYRALGRRDLLRARAVHVTSELEARGVKALEPSIEPVVVPNSVAWPERTLRSLPTEALRVLFLSRLHPKKRPEDLIRAVGEMTRAGRLVELTLAGPCAPSYRALLVALAEQHGVARQVKFPGFVEGAAKSQLWSTHDVFALPSEQENFGIAVAEAMAHGLPVVVSDQVALAEEISAADAGRAVPVGDVTGLRRALEACSDPVYRQRQGDNARACAGARFTDDRVREQLLALYDLALRA